MVGRRLGARRRDGGDVEFGRRRLERPVVAESARNHGGRSGESGKGAGVGGRLARVGGAVGGNLQHTFGVFFVHGSLDGLAHGAAEFFLHFGDEAVFGFDFF